MKRTVTSLVFVLLTAFAVPVAAQTNPCTDPPPSGTVINPTKLYVTSTDHTSTFPDSTPVLTDYQVGFFLSTADPATATPVQSTVTPKSAWTLVAGTSNCYQLTGLTTTLASVPAGINVSYVAAVKARGPGGESAYAASVSNPFLKANAPAVGKAVIRQ